ncbi:10852_t:CDS:2, partial [Gigaspora margarita]
TKKVNSNEISHMIKNIKEKIKGADAKSIANTPDISSTKTFEQSQEKIIKIQKDVLLFGFKTRAKGILDLNTTIKFINTILSNWCDYAIRKKIIAIKLNDPNYYPTNPILLPYKPKSVNETHKLFDSIPITNNISISKPSNKVCEKSSYNNIAKKSKISLLQLSSSILIQNQSNNSKQYSNTTKTKKEIPKSLFLYLQNILSKMNLKLILLSFIYKKI